MTGWHFAFPEEDVDFSYLASLKLPVYVLDPQNSGDEFHTAEQVKSLTDSGADVYAHIELGIIREHRPYFQQKWKQGQSVPPWIKREDLKTWGESYDVAFWDRNWQTVIHHYVDQIFQAPYTGLYLDGSNASYLNPERSNPEADMLRFIEATYDRLSRHLIDRKVIVKDPGRMIDHPKMTNLTKGVATENLFFYDDKPNLLPDDLTGLIRYRKYHGEVFVTEHALSANNAAYAKHECERYGFSLFIE